jgi:succinoglycan biosynthesis transport protein ExoP
MNGPEPQNQIILHVSPQQALAPFFGAPGASGGGPAPGGEPEDPPTIDFGGIFQALKRRWWVVALSLLLTIAAGITYIFKAERVYEAKGTVEVQQEKESLLGKPNSTGIDLKSLEMLKTIETTINGNSFMLRVIKDARLHEDPTWAPPREMAYQDDELVFHLQKKAAAVLSRGTRLIDITVQDSDPKRAQRITQAFLNECTRSTSAEDMAEAQKASAGLEKELEKSTYELEASELSLKQFRENHPELQLDENPSDLKQNPAETKVTTLSASVLEAKEEVLRLTNGIDQVRSAQSGRPEDLLNIAAIAASEEIVTLQKAFNEKSTQLAALDSRYLPKHPKVIAVTQEMTAIKASLIKAAQRHAANMENTLKAAQEKEAKLNEALIAAREASRDYQQIKAKFDVLASMNKVKQEHNKELLTRLKLVEVNQSFGGNVLRLKGAPILPTWPVKPSKKLILGASGLGGLMLGIGIVMLLYLLDRSVRNLDQGEQVFSLPGLAAVPDSPAKHPMDKLLNSPYTLPESAEAFRAMRTSLSLLGKGVHARSILFTSPDAGDGKSYCATNYALTLAQQGYRTLLVDADLRKPSLDLLLLGRRNPAGLISHLRGGGSEDSAKACTPTSIANLYLFSAGEAKDGHPAELLSSQAFRDLLADALKWFHRVVIDTPPVNVVSDALLLAREVDSVALVVRSGKTSRLDVRQAIRKLSAAGARPVGFILNAAEKAALTKGYTGEFNHAVINPLVPTRLSLPPGRHA